MVPKGNQRTDFQETLEVYKSWCILHIVKKYFSYCGFHADTKKQNKQKNPTKSASLTSIKVSNRGIARVN